MEPSATSTPAQLPPVIVSNGKQSKSPARSHKKVSTKTFFGPPKKAGVATGGAQAKNRSSAILSTPSDKKI
jgi:hypothetical protein